MIFFILRLLSFLSLRGTLFSKLVKTISSYYTTLLSNCVETIRKNLPPFVFLSQTQMKEMWKPVDFAARRLDLPLIYLVTDNLSLINSEKLKLCCNYEKESHLLHWRIFVTCKIKKQHLSGVSWTESCFYWTLWKFLGNYPLRRMISSVTL